MSARAIAIHGNEKSGERRANLEIKSECPALMVITILSAAGKKGILKLMDLASLQFNNQAL